MKNTSFKKNEFALQVIRTVREICHMVFNLSTDEQLEKAFGLNSLQLDMAINRIVNAMRDDLFAKPLPLLEEMKDICAREFIFFQVQEKCNDPHYQDDLANFICIFCRDIQQKVEACKTKPVVTTVNEENKHD